MADEPLADAHPLRVLLIEDSEDDADLALLELRRHGFAVVARRVETRAATVAALDGAVWDVVLSDHALPEFSSMGVLELLRRQAPDTPCIIVSGAIGEETAVQLLHSGAVDYVNKDKFYRLAPAVQRALDEAESRRARRVAEQALRELNETLEQRVEERTKELASQHNLLEAALNTLKDIFYVIDGEHRLVRWNRELSRATGLADDAVGGRRLTALVCHDDRAVTEEWIASVLERGAATVEVQLQLASGGVLPYEFTGVRLRDGDGRLVGVCGIGRDISARRQTEQHLKQAIREVIDDATWFAHSVLEKMNQVSTPRSGVQRVSDLTERELEVIELVAQGMKNNQIAERLGLSYATVRNYVARIYSKLEVHSRAEAVIWARERGFGNA